MEIGLLLIQVVIGAVVAAHGTQKLFGWFGGHGIGGTAAFMEALGLRPGRRMAIAAGTTEVAGGLLLAFGLATPLAALLVASTMFVAIFTASRGKGFWIYNGGFEYELVIAAVAVGLAFSGAGAWSLDGAIGWDVSGLAWGIGAAVLAALGSAAVLTAGRLRSRVTAPAVAGPNEA